MMGRSHAISGVLAAMALSAGTDMDAASTVLMCTTLPGFALLPDIDHANATVSRTFGPCTRIFSLVLGHRRETHSVPGILALALGTWYATLYPEHVASKIVFTVLLVLCWASVVRLFKLPGKIDDVLPVPVVVIMVWFPGVLDMIGIPRFPMIILPFALAFGMIVHVLGDVITKQGCPLWWPFSSTRTALSITVLKANRKTGRRAKRIGIKAGGKFEYFVIVPIMILGIGVLTWLSMVN